MSNRLVRPGQQQSAADDSESPAALDRWGQMYLASLRKNDPTQYHELETQGELEKVARSKAELAAAEYRGTLNHLLASEPEAKSFAQRQAQIERMKRTAEEVAEQNVRVPTPKWASQTTSGYTDENTADEDQEPLLPKAESPTT